MNINLNYLQLSKINNLVTKKEDLTSKIKEIESSLNDVIDLVLDFNEICKDEVEKIELKENVLCVSLKTNSQ